MNRPSHVPRIAPRAACFAALLLATGLEPTGAAEQRSPRKITTVEGITEYELANGLDVLLFPDPTKSTVTVNVTYLVGSRHEGRGEAGMAHLLEHMVFKGTDTYENIWGALQDHGALFNGSTWVDRTNYFETLPASEENLDFALHLEADRMVNSRITAEDLAKEMTVVRNEFEMGENYPTRIMWERMMSAAFLWHNYGKSTIGNRSDLERVPVENLRRFYERYYQPDNAMLVVAGNFDPEWALERIERYFGAIPRPQRKLAETYTDEPVQDGPRSIVLKRVGSGASTGLLYHTPAGAHPDTAALEVLADVLTDEPSGRLYEALVESDKAARVYHRLGQWREPGITGFVASVRLDQDVDEAQRVMIDVVEGVGSDPVSEEEVERAKKSILKDVNLALTDSRRVGIELSEWEALGDWRMLFVHRDRLADVTVEDVNRVAGSYFVESNRTAGKFVPTEEPVRAEIPPTPDVDRIVDGYESSKTIDRGERFLATSRNIETHTRRLELENGMKLALLPKETRGNVVHGNLVFRFGSAESLRGMGEAVSLLPSLMMRGTAERDYESIQDELDRIETRLSLYGGAGSLNASLQTTRENLPAALFLLGEILRRPALPDEELEVLRKQRLADLEQALTDPRQLLFTHIFRTLSPFPQDDVRYRPTIEERIERTERITREEIADLYDRFLGAENGLASFVGDFDADELRRQLEETLGDWTAREPWSRLEDPYHPVEARTETIDTPDKKMAAVARATTLALREDDPEYPALDFANFVLGQSSKSRLLTTLRHEGGLSYTATSFFDAGLEDRSGFFLAFAICAPQNVGETASRMSREIEHWLSQPLGPEEVEEFKTGYLEEFKTGLGDDRSLSQRLLTDLRVGRSFLFRQQVVDEVAELDATSIHRAVKKLLGDKPFVEVRAGDVSNFDTPPETSTDEPPSER